MNEFDYKQQLQALDDAYASAETREGFASLPAGRYNAILKEARIVPRQSGGIALSVSFIVTEGDYKGRMAFTSYGLNANGMPYLKGFLHTIGVQLDKLSELDESLLLFPGRMVAISVQPQKDNPQYTNTYVDRYIGMGRLEEYLPGGQKSAAASGQDDFSTMDDTEDLPFD